MLHELSPPRQFLLTDVNYSMTQHTTHLRPMARDGLGVEGGGGRCRTRGWFAVLWATDGDAATVRVVGHPASGFTIPLAVQLPCGHVGGRLFREFYFYF